MTVAPILLSANLEEKTYEVKDKNNIMIHNYYIESKAIYIIVNLRTKIV